MRNVSYCIIILVILGFSTIGTHQTDAMDLTMDLNLSRADASFIGENARDGAGIACTIVGDVNGDGYDDIVIGAWKGFYGSGPPGEAYLVFGDGSNLSRDMSLADADASFVGEYDGRVGRSVAGPGDVNGDGYDDILLGDFNHDHPANKMGKTYLIFGKPSGWRMDTPVTESDASFIGEHEDDESGWSIAGAGDVNRDGYDDFLIGARSSEESAPYAGQTYLILGKASGWSNNVSLSDADASFRGLKYESTAGSVAGAGDVNGDGYPDLIIGARGCQNAAGENIGGAYLVFGGDSGWSVDFNLSRANASFLAEDSSDWAGSCVAGAGDVNGDGYDDIIIGAEDAYWNLMNPGKVYLVLGKATGWRKYESLANSDASFIGENDDSNTGFSVAGLGDVNHDGYDDFVIGAPFYNDGRNRVGQSYLILGRPNGWERDTSLANVDASFLGENDGDRAGAAVAGGGDVNGDGLNDVLIGASNNNDGGQQAGKTYLVYGRYTPPRIQLDSTPGSATTGDAFTFNVTTYSGNDLVSVSFEYWYGDSGPRSNRTADLASGTAARGTWLLNTTVPADMEDMLHYIVHLEGPVFSTQTEMRDVFVLDNDPPVFSEDTTPSEATTGDDFVFSINVTENIGIPDVRVDHWFKGFSTHYNDSMTHTGGDRWTAKVTVPADTTTDIMYFFYAVDGADNAVMTSTRTVSVIDDDAPVFLDDLTPEEATTGDDLTFNALVMDNVDVEEVLVTYWSEVSGDRINESLLDRSSDSWMLSVTIPSDWVGELYYFFSAWDGTNPWVTTPVETIPVSDNDEPVFIQDRTPDAGTTGDDLEVIIEMADNIEVTDAKIFYRFGTDDPWIEMSMSRIDSAGWMFRIAVPSDSLGPLMYRIEASDKAGNVNKTVQRTLPILDNDVPVLEEGSVPSEVVKGLESSFGVKVEDNVGVEVAHLEYWFGDGNHMNVSSEGPSYRFDVQVPRHPEGDLRYFFSAKDTSGNWGRTDEWTLDMVNSPPEISQIPSWQIVESTDASLDLDTYLSDPNDDGSGLVITCDDDNISIDGLTLKARYDIALPDWTIHISVSDGEDSTSGEIVVHIENVNDAPVIISVLPENGSRYKEGEEVAFAVVASDEDEDDLVITWVADWGTIGTGATLDYDKLKPGTHTIKVRVFDGTESVEEEISIVIKKEQESPGYSISLVLLAFALAFLVECSRRRTV